MYGLSSLMARKLTKSMVRHYARPGGDPAWAFPIDLTSKYRITAIFTIYFGIAFGAPWLIIRYQMLKGT